MCVLFVSCLCVVLYVPFFVSVRDFGSDRVGGGGVVIACLVLFTIRGMTSIVAQSNLSECMYNCKNLAFSLV